MLRKNSILLMISCLAANTMTFAANTYKDYQPPNKPFFILLGAGGSYSDDADISVNLKQWDPAKQGYSDDVGGTVLYTVGLGYQIMPLFALDVEVTERPSFGYTRYQTPTANSSTPGFAGIKTRKFDLDSTSIMANVLLNGQSANLFMNLGHDVIVQPIVGAGLGIAYNKVSNFHSVQAVSSSPGSNNVTSTMQPKTDSAFAWQAFIAIEALYGAQWALDIGYRYFDGGDFESNNFLTDIPSGLSSQVTASPWKGELTANEWFINLKYFI